MKVVNFQKKEALSQPILILIVCLLSSSAVGQDLKRANEQDFVIAHLRESIERELDEEKVFINSRIGYSMYILGIGNIKFNYVVPGLRSCTRFKRSKNINVKYRLPPRGRYVLKVQSCFEIAF